MTGGALERNWSVRATGAAAREPGVARLGQRHEAGASASGAGMTDGDGLRGGGAPVVRWGRRGGQRLRLGGRGGDAADVGRQAVRRPRIDRCGGRRPTGIVGGRRDLDCRDRVRQVRDARIDRELDRRRVDDGLGDGRGIDHRRGVRRVGRVRRVAGRGSGSGLAGGGRLGGRTPSAGTAVAGSLAAGGSATGKWPARASGARNANEARQANRAAIKSRLRTFARGRPSPPVHLMCSLSVSSPRSLSPWRVARDMPPILILQPRGASPRAGDGHLRRELRHGRQAADRAAQDRRLEQVPPDLDRPSGGGGDPDEAPGRDARRAR